MMDLDNAHSEDSSQWKNLVDVQAAFPCVAFYAVPSRNYMKSKINEKTGEVFAPREKYHLYFQIDLTTSAEEYAAMKKRTIAAFPFLDIGARDAARFFFGVENPQVEYYPGEFNLSDFLRTAAPPVESKAAPAITIDPITGGRIIPEGERNNRLSYFAGQILKRYGDTDGKAYQAFRQEAALCSPPLDESELAIIWGSALGFYQTVKAQPGYIPPDEYAVLDFVGSLKPTDFTDIGQARVLAKEYRDKLRFSKATKYLISRYHVTLGLFLPVVLPTRQKADYLLSLKRLL